MTIFRGSGRKTSPSVLSATRRLGSFGVTIAVSVCGVSALLVRPAECSSMEWQEFSELVELV
jgi:hypothetical protein